VVDHGLSARVSAYRRASHRARVANSQQICVAAVQLFNRANFAETARLIRFAHEFLHLFIVLIIVFLVVLLVGTLDRLVLDAPRHLFQVAG